MNPNSSQFGSIWRKWDLHFHTPASYDYEFKAATNKEIVEGLVKAGVEVVAITDHHRIDTARIIELQKLGGTNLTVLPGIEFCSSLCENFCGGLSQEGWRIKSFRFWVLNLWFLERGVRAVGRLKGRCRKQKRGKNRGAAFQLTAAMSVSKLTRLSTRLRL